LNGIGKGVAYHMDFLMPFFLSSPINYDRKFGILKNRGKPHAPHLVRYVYAILGKCDEAREEAFYPDVPRNVLWTMVYDGRLTARVHEKSVYFSVRTHRRYIFSRPTNPPSITVTSDEIVGDPNVLYTTIRILPASLKDAIKAMTTLYDYDRGNLLYSAGAQETVRLKNTVFPFTDEIT